MHGNLNYQLKKDIPFKVRAGFEQLLLDKTLYCNV